MKKSLRVLTVIIRKMPTKRYTDYIRSKRWATVRDEYLDAVERWCEVCKKRPACQVHHVSYARLGYERWSDLCAVCVDCHHKLHAELVPANDNDQPDLFEEPKKAS